MTTLETFGMEMTQTKLRKPDDVIVILKAYYVNREYGWKLAGLRGYDKNDKVVLSVGWFQDAQVVKTVLKPNERITGVEGFYVPERDSEKGLIPN